MTLLEKGFSHAGLSTYAVVSGVFVLFLLVRFALNRPKLIPGVPVIGLDGGNRSLAEARHEFMDHGGAMVKEGYEKVLHLFWTMDSSETWLTS